MRRRLLLVVFAIAIAGRVDAAVDVQLVASGVPYLVGIEHAGDGSGRLFLVSQPGRILICTGTQLLATPFLDLSSLVSFSGEQGLLGLAFHPQYTINGFFYVNYINLSGNTVVARYHVSADANVADPSSATILLTQVQPFANHNGGQVRFGPDGLLYIGLGDGGSGGDPLNNGQSLGTLLGKLLRIDVNSASPYAIPADNPFVGTPGARGEIWSYGLRNPWRFSFDRATGDLWIADVGQNLWEEVDIQAAGHGGENYGWRSMEGLHCFNPSTGCYTSSLALPVLEYSHAVGCSITGGFRYRGAQLDHVGTYFFADLCSGHIWGATMNADGTWRVTQLLSPSLTITTFGEDAAGEIYLSHYASSGALYRLVAKAPAPPTLTVARVGGGVGRISSSPTGLDCGFVCAAQLAGGTVVTLTATPASGSTFAGWSGDADCSDGVVTVSADRSCTAIFTAGFTDDPIIAGATVAKATHVTELRARIDQLRANAGLGPFAWTDPELTAGTTPIRVVHVIDMRTALGEVYAAVGQPPPHYTDAALATGDAIKAVHLSELRVAVVILE